MRVLFDQCTPAPLRHLLVGHEVTTAHELGWSQLKNGELLSAAELQSFEVLVTTDASLRYQQNLSMRTIAIVVLSTTSWPRIKAACELIAAAVAASPQVHYAEIAIP